MAQTMGGIYAVVLPFLAHGHMIPFLHLSRMLAVRGVTVIYVSTPSNVGQIRWRVEGWDDVVHFEELPMPSSPLPPGCENTSQVPREMIPFVFEAIEKLEHPFHALMEKLAKSGSGYYEEKGLAPPERLILIHDVNMGWAETVAAAFRVPSFTFIGLNAFTWLSMKARYLGEEPPEELRDIVRQNKVVLPSVIRDVMRRQMEFNRRTKGILVNTFPEMEPKFLDRLADAEKNGGTPLWAVGPVNDVLASKPGEREKMDKEKEGHSCLRWLDRQNRASVVYVAFGSETPISGEQTRELGLGLEASGQPFLWVIKPPADCCSTDWKSEALPADFEDRVKGRGFIEFGWAPQNLILSHQSTGAYVTHCGWNSVCEGVIAGVPMIAWPFFSYLSSAAVILTREVKVAVAMGRTMEDGGDTLVTAEEVARAICRVMREEEGNAIKKRMLSLSAAANRAIDPHHGSAWKALDSFLEYAKQ